MSLCGTCMRPKRRRGRPVPGEFCECPRGREDDYHKRNLKQNYNLLPGEYSSMLDAQGGVCAICSSRPGKRRLAVDHCHETGVIRGLLCGRCNGGLGFFKDNPAVMRMAVRYVSR